jgi:hypothetical protein
MCRNITELRGLEPPATDDEVEAAARQFIRKLSGLQRPPIGAEPAYERAIAHVTAEVHALPAAAGPPAAAGHCPAAAPSGGQGPHRRAGGVRRGREPCGFEGCAYGYVTSAGRVTVLASGNLAVHLSSMTRLNTLLPT